MEPGQERRQVSWIQVSKSGFTGGFRVSARYAVDRRRCEKISAVKRLAEINEQTVDEFTKLCYGKALHFALRYKPEGRGFDSRLCHWNFSLT